MKYFVISDPHSYYSIMIKTLTEKGYDKDNPDHTLVICGDLFDRGEESKEMFEFVKGLSRERFIYIKGNHEDLLEMAYNEIIKGKGIGGHHYSNGTIKTICDLSDVSPIYDVGIVREVDKKIEVEIKKVLDFIHERCVNYFETEHYIFVHGWIPTKNTKEALYHTRGIQYEYIPDWRKCSEEEWANARWDNGMQLYQKGICEPNKTIVCGHWHCSWGWSHIDQKRKEFPPKNHINWEKSFEPYIKDGIAAIDSCTAYSGIINCLVLEEK